MTKNIAKGKKTMETIKKAISIITNVKKVGTMRKASTPLVIPGMRATIAARAVPKAHDSSSSSTATTRSRILRDSFSTLAHAMSAS